MGGGGGSVCMSAWINAQMYVSDVVIIAISFL